MSLSLCSVPMSDYRGSSIRVAPGAGDLPPPAPVQRVPYDRSILLVNDRAVFCLRCSQLQSLFPDFRRLCALCGRNTKECVVGKCITKTLIIILRFDSEMKGMKCCKNLFNFHSKQEEHTLDGARCFLITKAKQVSTPFCHLCFLLLNIISVTGDFYRRMIYLFIAS